MRGYSLLVGGLCLWLAGCSSEPPPEAAKAPPPAPPPAEAGSVTARLPEGQIQRAALSLPSTVGTKVLWKDFVVTDAKGRARITLLDASILNVGTDSKFEVVRHDARSDQTEIELTAGKLRSRVTKRGESQKFEIKTNSAVIGVVGTDFFVRATPKQTRVVVYEGAVRVRSADPNIAGETIVKAGQMVVVNFGQPPGPTQPVTRAVVEESLRDTDVGPPLPIAQPPVQIAEQQPPSAGQSSPSRQAGPPSTESPQAAPQPAPPPAVAPAQTASPHSRTAEEIRDLLAQCNVDHSDGVLTTEFRIVGDSLIIEHRNRRNAESLSARLRDLDPSNFYSISFGRWVGFGCKSEAGACIERRYQGGGPSFGGSPSENDTRASAFACGDSNPGCPMHCQKLPSLVKQFVESAPR